MEKIPQGLSENKEVHQWLRVSCINDLHPTFKQEIPNLSNQVAKPGFEPLTPYSPNLLTAIKSK